MLKYTKAEFISTAWDTTGRKVSKRAWLSDFYETAGHSIGIPVPEDSEAVRMFRLVLEDHIELCKMRQRIEQQAQGYMRDNADYHRLQTIPGIGPITGLSILAETGDMRRFSHYKKFLKYCGLDLSTEQSGRFRGMSKLSKRGNSRLRLAFWVAATVAIRMRENTFRQKYERYIRTDPANKDLKRQAYTTVAAKMARVAYSVIKTGTDYRCFHETAIPSGKIPSPPVEDLYDSLTDREKQVLKLIAEGYTHKEIADILGISLKTAVAHQTNLSEKINLHSRAALIKFAIEKGIIKIDA